MQRTTPVSYIPSTFRESGLRQVTVTVTAVHRLTARQPSGRRWYAADRRSPRPVVLEN
jgi:hypothetical protein